MLVAVIICGIALAGIGLVVFFGTAETDEARVVRYLAAQGGELKRMAPVPDMPLGITKIGRRGGHVYTINYLDAEDRYHFAECETNAAIGVVLRRDGIREDDLGSSDLSVRECLWPSHPCANYPEPPMHASSGLSW